MIHPPHNDGEPLPLEVVRIDGRYPYQPMTPSVFRSENIISDITPHEDGTATIRLSDSGHSDMWIALTVRGSVVELMEQVHPLPNGDP